MIMKTTERTVKEVLTLLKYTYPNTFKDFTKEDGLMMIKVWVNDFKDIEEDIFKQAIERIRSKSKYFPSVAEIKSEISTIKVKDLQLDPEEQWELVLLAIRRGILKTTYFEEITNNTIRAIGINRLETLETNQIPFMKKEFIDIFTNKKVSTEKIYIQEKSMLTNTELLKLQQKEEQAELDKYLDYTDDLEYGE